MRKVEDVDSSEFLRWRAFDVSWILERSSCSFDMTWSPEVVENPVPAAERLRTLSARVAADLREALLQVEVPPVLGFPWFVQRSKQARVEGRCRCDRHRAVRGAPLMHSRGSDEGRRGSGSRPIQSLFSPTATAVRPARRRRTDGPARPGHPRPDRPALANGRSVGDRGVLRSGTGTFLNHPDGWAICAIFIRRLGRFSC